MSEWSVRLVTDLKMPEGGPTDEQADTIFAHLEGFNAAFGSTSDGFWEFNLHVVASTVASALLNAEFSVKDGFFAAGLGSYAVTEVEIMPWEKFVEGEN